MNGWVRTNCRRSQKINLNTFSVISKEAPRGVLIAVSNKELNYWRLSDGVNSEQFQHLSK